MSVEDAKKAVDVGASAIMVSNHGGRQLDGSRSPFDQLAEIVDAVGDKIDVICEGDQKRNTCFKSIIFRSKSLLWWENVSLCFSCRGSKKELKKCLIYVMKLKEI